MPTPKGGSSSTPASSAAAAAEVLGHAFVTCEVLRSRFTFIPEPKLGLAGPNGPMYARKPVVATQDSAVSGLVGALENKLARLGAAWLSSDGTVAGHKAAWEAFMGLGRKLTTKTGKSPLLALVRVEQDATISGSGSSTGSSTASGAGSDTGSGPGVSTIGTGEIDAAEKSEEGTAAGTEAAAVAAADEQQEAGQDQQQQQKGQGGKQQRQQRKGPALPGYRLHMLIVQDEDVSRGIMQVGRQTIGLMQPRSCIVHVLRLLLFEPHMLGVAQNQLLLMFLHPGLFACLHCSSRVGTLSYSAHCMQHVPPNF